MDNIFNRKFINISSETGQKQINSGSKAKQFIGICKSSCSAKDETNDKFKTKKFRFNLQQNFGEWGNQGGGDMLVHFSNYTETSIITLG